MNTVLVRRPAIQSYKVKMRLCTLQQNKNVITLKVKDSDAYTSHRFFRCSTTALHIV